MIRVTKPGGQTVMFDAVLPDAAWRRPLAWLVRRLDLGARMRPQAGLEALLGVAETWRCRRVSYARSGLEALVAVRRKP
jgi:hypothetical protein